MTTDGGEEWDRFADVYEAAFEPITSAFGEILLTKLPLHAGDRLLDVGAGVGAGALSAARRGINTIAIDFSSKFVQRIRARAAAVGLSSSRLWAEVMDGCNLDLPDASFDAATSAFGVMFFSDRKKSYQEILRVLKPGARFAQAVWAAPHLNDSHALMAQAQEFAALQLPSQPPPSWGRLAVPGEGAAELADAGFVECSTEQVQRTWKVESIAWLWQQLPRISPISARQFAGMDESQIEQLGAAYLRIGQERFGDGAVELNATALLITGRRPA